MTQLLISFSISFFIGLLVGIERERSHPEGYQAIGVRTFILFALLGTVAATLQQQLITFALCLFVFSIIIVSYLRATILHKKNIDIGITTEVAAALVFLIGYLLTIYPLTSITISAVILLTLIERKHIHAFSREVVRSDEIEAIIILVIFAVGILPILPDRTIDPWKLFNPRNFAILLVLITAIQLFGHLSIRVFGSRLGRAITGFFGGLISSTAVFATLKENLGSGKYALATMASAIFATLAMIAEFAVIVLVASLPLFLSLVWPIAVMLVVASVIAFLLIFQQKEVGGNVKMQKPLKFTSLVFSATFVGILLILTSFSEQYFGVQGTSLLAFFGGLFELHAITLATTLLYLDHNISLTDTSTVLAMAMLAAFVSKFILLAFLTPRNFALKTSGLLLAILSSGAFVYFLG